MYEISRRDFLRWTAATGLTLGASGLGSGCGEKDTDISTSRGAPSTEPVRVAAIRGQNLYDMTRRALDGVGGIQRIVRKGESVFIKPNFAYAGWAYDPHTGGCTKPEIVIAVAEECLKAGAAEVIIGDGGQLRRWSWEKVTTLDGSSNLAEAVETLCGTYGKRIRLACLEEDTTEWVEIDTMAEIEPGTHRLRVSNLYLHADRVISIPVLKTHQWAYLTLSMKNLFGVTPVTCYSSTPQVQPMMRDMLHAAYGKVGGIERCYLDIMKARKPDLAIIDGSIGIEGNGPMYLPGLSSPVDLRERLDGDWLLLASTDAVACDATAARVVKHAVEHVPQLMMAYQDGLGEIREQRIQLIGASLEEIQVDWRPAVHIDEWGVLPSVHASVKGASSVRHTRISNYLSPLLCPTALACILKWIHGRRMRPADLEKLERLSSDS